MNSILEIKRKDQYSTSLWSGGTTTELLIYPNTSTYNEKNFKWRISSAKVDMESSTFTNLPGISRCIMLIEGNMTLEHPNKYIITLEVFQQDSFMGDWGTKSVGKARDFNLMLAEGYRGNLEVITLKALEEKALILKNSTDESITDVFYAAESNVDIVYNNKKIGLKQQDLIAITHFKDVTEELKLINNSEEDMRLIRTIVIY